MKGEAAGAASFSASDEKRGRHRLRAAEAAPQPQANGARNGNGNGCSASGTRQAGKESLQQENPRPKSRGKTERSPRAPQRQGRHPKPARRSKLNEK
jgi:Tfp pilus assembly protein FimV